MTSEDLGNEPGVFEQVKFEYSLLGKVFNKRLETEDKKEKLLKRIKNTEDTIKDQIKSQLKPIENDINNAIRLPFKKLRILCKLSLEAKEILNKIQELSNETDYTKLICVHTNGKIFDFNILTF